jgi:hypothetical protein
MPQLATFLDMVFSSSVRDAARGVGEPARGVASMKPPRGGDVN